MKEENTYNKHIGINTSDHLRMNPFGVPEGYFMGLEQSVFERLAEQKLKSRIATTGFGLPEGYFEQLNESIASKILEQKLKDQVTDTGFTIPEDYFETSRIDILTTITEQGLQEQVSNEGYSVPTNYFEDLADRTMSMAKIELQAPSTKNTFTIPHQYFEELSANIMDMIAADKVQSGQNDTDIPVVQMPVRKNWSQYAAAAVVALMISVGSYWALDSGRQAQVNTDVNLALDEISNEEIFNYLTQVTDDGIELIELASFLHENNMERPFEVNDHVKDQEIEEYLNYML